MQSGPRPPRFESVAELVEAWRPNLPVFCIRPSTITAATRRFGEFFPGRVLYAVKCNPHPLVMEAIRRGGVGHFDVASLSEIEQVGASFPDGAGLYFMHPVKDRAAIRAAYRHHGIRHFVVDHADELEKVSEETGGRDLFVFVRVRTPESRDVLYHLAAKFGAGVSEAADLVRAAVARGCRVGLTFHVGSQCLEPKAYRTALELLGQVVERSGQRPECIDVGGGFPHDYPDVEAPPFEAYVKEIQLGLRSTGLDDGPALWAEPGRALVAAGCSVLTQVRLRKGDLIYLNDGVYGSFSELIDSEYRLPARVFSARGARAEGCRDFVVHGPTCDSMDVLGSTLRLPENVAEGDWIEVGQIGAYSNALSTRFNGFALERFAELGDAPLLFDGDMGEEVAVLDSS
jgi:ornithine decarboxylase